MTKKESLSIKARNLLRPILDEIDPGRNIRRRMINFTAQRKYSGLEVVDAAKGNALIADALQTGQPFAAGKFGATESKFINAYKKRDFRKVNLFAEELHLHSGVFPISSEALQYFVREYELAAKNVDLLGVWYQNGERELIASTESQSREGRVFFDFTGTEPYYFNEPWSTNLVGKRVLVISPFTESISSQYLKRQKIWKGSMLPEFELKTLRFPHSDALGNNGHSSWKSILETYKEKMSSEDYDIVLTGCGAATLPLATFAKLSGKQGIGLGGSLQILFGICGRRWDNHPFFRKLINSDWIRPAASETPEANKKIENAAYW